MLTAGAARARADRQPRRLLVEPQAHRRQHSVAPCPRPLLVEVADTSTERHGVIAIGAPIAARNSATRSPAARPAAPPHLRAMRPSSRCSQSDGWPHHRRPSRPWLGAGSGLLQKRSDVSQFGYPPSLSACGGEPCRDGGQRGYDVRPGPAARRYRDPPAAVRRSTPLRKWVPASAAESRDVAAAVVDAEHEPARQMGQRGLRTESPRPIR